MLQGNIEGELGQALERIAQETGKSASEDANVAVHIYLEDREDYLVAVEAAKRAEPTYSYDEVRQRLSLGA